MQKHKVTNLINVYGPLKFRKDEIELITHADENKLMWCAQSKQIENLLCCERTRIQSMK